MEITVEVDIAATPSQVWAALMDIEAWPRSTASMTAVTRLDVPPLRVGSRARIRQPGMPALIWQVTELSVAESFTWTTRSPGVSTVGRHELRATPKGTRLILGIEQRGPIAGVVGLLLGRRTRRYVTMEAEGIKSVAEAAAASTTSAP